MRRPLLLGLLLYGLLLLGLAGMRGALLALAIPLVVYLGAALLDRPQAPRLSATRTLSSARVMPGAPVTVTLAITNGGARLDELLLEDPTPAGLAVIDGATSLLATLDPGATIELSYTVSGGRGLHQFADLRATARDRLGLFEQRIALAAPAQLVVVPQVVRLRRMTLRPRRTRIYAGAVPARSGGPGVEFFGVREYQAGDPTRWINGRLTARHPEALYVNEFEQERVTDVGLILDARRPSDVRTSQGALFEHGVQAAATLADALLAHGNRVGLLVHGSAISWTLPGYGKVQRERILRALAGAGHSSLPLIDRLDYVPVRVFPARSQLILISPLLPHDHEALIRLRARGYQLLVISPDPIAFERQGLEADAAVALSARVARIERTLLLRRLWRAGIPVIEWAVDRPFQQVAEAALGRVQLWSGPAAGAL
ncbi:MAG: DUF58 domain-containing protein [Kouleothrix sp.]|nr:DUF58 domain-containing protein [Kouleothrix sp.]